MDLIYYPCRIIDFNLLPHFVVVVLYLELADKLNIYGIVDKMVANFEIPYAYWTKWWLISDFSHFFYLENPV